MFTKKQKQKEIANIDCKFVITAVSCQLIGLNNSGFKPVLNYSVKLKSKTDITMSTGLKPDYGVCSKFLFKTLV